MSKARSIEEVKDDIRERVGDRAPFLHADKAEAEEALAQNGALRARLGPRRGTHWAPAGKTEPTALRKPATALKPKKLISNPTATTASPATPFQARRASATVMPRPARCFSPRRNTSIFRWSGCRFRSGQSHRRPPAAAEKASRADDHALGRHRQLERRTPLLRRIVRQRGLGLLHHGQPGHRRVPGARRTRRAQGAHRGVRLFIEAARSRRRQDRRRRRQLRRPLVDQAGSPRAGQAARRGQLGRRDSLFFSARVAGAVAPRRLLSSSI